MARRKVTDPALLEALSAPQAPDLLASHAPTTGPRKVTDPAVLAALEGNGPGRGEALARGIKQGLTADFGDEIDAFRSANASLVPEGLRTVVSSLPLVGMAFGTAREADTSNPTLSDIAAGRGGGGWADRFKRVLASERAKNSAAKEAHKGWYVGGEIGGGLATSAIPGGAAVKGAGLAAKIAAGAKTGAAMGALYGAGGSEADTLSGIASDAALGGAVGSVAGGAAPIVGAGLKRAAAPVARWLQERALESGRKALSGIGTPLAARKEIPEAVVNQALDTGAIKPFGTVTGAAQRLGTQAEQLGAVYGKLIDDLSAAGVTGPNAELMAQEALRRATAAGRVLSRAEKGEWEQLAQDLLDAVPSKPFASRRLGLPQTQEIKHNLQTEAKSAYDVINRRKTPKQEALEKVAAYVRGEMEDAVAQQASKAPNEAAAFEPVKARLANVLGALKPAEEGAARAARRAPPSLVPAVAVEAITGTPGAGLLPLLARLADRRVSSTVARSSRAGAKLLEALGRSNLTPAQAAEAERLAAFIAASQRQGVPALVPAAAGEDQ